MRVWGDPGRLCGDMGRLRTCRWESIWKVMQCTMRAMVFGSVISLGGAHLLRYVGRKRRVFVSSRAEQR